MYNRYIPDENGVYRRIPMADPVHEEKDPPPPMQETGKQERKHLLSGLISKLKPDNIDTGDLLLLAIVFLLFREGEDEELLIALILLLIL